MKKSSTYTPNPDLRKGTEAIVGVVEREVWASLYRLFKVWAVGFVSRNPTNSLHSAFWYKLNELNLKLRVFTEQTDYHERKEMARRFSVQPKMRLSAPMFPLLKKKKTRRKCQIRRHPERNQSDTNPESALSVSHHSDEEASDPKTRKRRIPKIVKRSPISKK